jgi:hypothetical protein
MNSSAGSASASTLFRKAMLLPAVTMMALFAPTARPFSRASLASISATSGP